MFTSMRRDGAFMIDGISAAESATRKPKRLESSRCAQDRSPAACAFASVGPCRKQERIRDREWWFLTLAIERMANAIRQPDVRLFFTSLTPALTQRSENRGRLHESSMPPFRLTEPDGTHASWISAGSKDNLVVDAERFDFATDRSDRARNRRVHRKSAGPVVGRKR